MDKKQIQSAVEPMLEKFGISHLKKTITTKLSGGEKRKLSILTAYLGDPALVILDEPTTGIDPFSRRSIWDVLLHHRLNTATILSTHFMDEADLLSDRIAVISDGTLRCVGSPMYLKNKYGHGFRIITACTDKPHSIENTKAFFHDCNAGVELTQMSGRDLTFTVPKEHARGPEMIEILKSIEANRDEIGIQSFGVSEPTLEEAFFEAAEINPHETKQNFDQADDAKLIRRPSSARLGYENQTGLILWVNQFVALLKKRFVLAIRTPSALAFQILLPLTFIIIFLLTSNELMQTGSSKLVPVHIYQPYRTNVLFFQDKTSTNSEDANATFRTLLQRGLGPRCPNGYDGLHCGPSTDNVQIPDQSFPLSANQCSGCVGYCAEGNARQAWSWMTPSSDLVYKLPSSMDANDWILSANQSDHWVVGGFQFHAYNYTFDDSDLGVLLASTTPKAYVVIWTRNEIKMAMLNAYNNLLVRTFSSDKSYSIQAHFEYLRFPLSQTDKPQGRDPMDVVGSIVGTMLLVLAFIFAAFGVAVTIQQEKAANLKELQYVSGAHPSAYWLANYAWDLGQFMVTFTILILVLAVFKNGLSSNLKDFVNVLIPYGFGAVSFIYVVSLVFKSSTAVNRVVLILGMISLQLGTGVTSYELTSTFITKETNWSIYLGYLLRFIPFYYLPDGCFAIVFVLAQKLLSGVSTIDLYDTNLLGKRIIQGYASAVFWLALLILLEYWRSGFLRLSFFKPKPTDNAISHGSDPDVEAEERRVLQNGSLHEPVVVKKVSKKYAKAAAPAVDSVTFAIPRSQCFGLLGVNGAGKTSLFRIMTGFHEPTVGHALIEGKDVMNEKFVLSRKISYCPQDNTLFDNLSAKEHLKLFASFRGVPRAYADDTVESLIREVGLEQHAQKLAKHLSGGNKRKLNFALALLDYKPVIFLDEPTSGMDPGARRRTWTCIQEAIVKGCSVVLTSHSMDECEALCHRLVIMARGKLCCIGSVQYLKDKFGNCYTAKIKLANTVDANRSTEINRLKEHISKWIPDACLTEEHRTMLQYETASSTSGLPLSSLFNFLCECERHFPDLIEDFTLSQVTLERVFVGMAQRRQNVQQGSNQNLVATSVDA